MSLAKIDKQERKDTKGERVIMAGDITLKDAVDFAKKRIEEKGREVAAKILKTDSGFDVLEVDGVTIGKVGEKDKKGIIEKIKSEVGKARKERAKTEGELIAAPEEKKKEKNDKQSADDTVQV